MYSVAFNALQCVAVSRNEMHLASEVKIAFIIAQKEIM